MSTQYEALNYDGTERRANYRFVSYRIDILHILDKKEAAAIIFEILYRWEVDVHCKRLLKDIETRKKAGLPPLTEEEVADQMWTYMSYNDFVRESGSALGYNTVIRMLAYLIDEKGIIEQRENHDPRYPDYEYRINKEVVRKLLKDLPVSPVFAAKVPKKKKSSTQMGIPLDDSTQMGIPAHDSTQMGIGYTQQGTEVYPFGGTSQNDTENTQKEGTNATADSTNPNASLSFPPSFFSLSPEDQLAYLETETARLRQTMDAKEITSSSKPSDDTTLSTELPTGVDNGQAVKPTDASLIVNETTSNPTVKAAPAQGEPVTTRNTSNEANTGINAKPLTPKLSEEEQRIHRYWQELGFEADITPKLKEHWGKLTKHTKSFEQFKSLYEHTRRQIENNPEIKNKRVSPGNLTNTNNLNGWKQAQMPVSKPETTFSKTASASGMRNYTFEPEKTTTTETPEGKRKLPEFKLRRPNKTASVAQ